MLKLELDMFEWINNLVMAGSAGMFAITGIFFIRYASVSVVQDSTGYSMYDCIVKKGCSFRQMAWYVHKIPCRSTLIGEIL